MLVPAATLSSPDLKLETNSNSLAVNSRRHSNCRSGHFSHGTFRPDGAVAACTVVAEAAAILPSWRNVGDFGPCNVWEQEKVPSHGGAFVTDRMDERGAQDRPLAVSDDRHNDFAQAPRMKRIT